ncbi:MAG: putative Histidine kinase [Promethearchaeota archaeon]|nr:MAG: putative Histidine kinase [Candidatus Lokiarchaeota archaeon]
MNSKDIDEAFLNVSEIKVLNSIQELVAVYDINLTIVWVNTAAAESVNLKPDDMIGRHCYEFWEMDNTPCDGCPVKNAIITKSKEEITRKTPDGRIWDLKGYPIKDDSDEVIGAIEIGLEITEKIKMQNKIKESEIKYREAYNHLNFYEDLFHHDLSNILQSLLSSIELSKICSNERRLTELNNILSLAKNQIARGKLLISNVKNLIDLDKEEIVLKELNLLEFLDLSIEFIKNVYKDKDIEIEIDTMKDEIIVFANSGLKDIFINILTNAIEHNRHKGVEIEIHISFTEQEGQKFVKIQIMDNGPGIHDDLKKNIIKHISGEKRSKKRFGLGLILAKRILDSYGADLLIKNRRENDHSIGSNIILLIPDYSQ